MQSVISVLVVFALLAAIVLFFIGVIRAIMRKKSGKVFAAMGICFAVVFIGFVATGISLAFVNAKGSRVEADAGNQVGVGFASGTTAAITEPVQKTTKSTVIATTTAKETEIPLPTIGQEISVEQVSYVVEKVEVSQTVGEDYVNSTAKGTYLILTISITNNSSEPLTISDSFFTILFSGKKYSADSTATLYADSENSLWYDELNPDLTTKGTVAFDVTEEVANSSETQLQVQTGFWGTQTGIISLAR